MKNYKRHKMQMFKGIYTDIPSPINFSSDSMVYRSVRYSGFLVGHTACGFLLYFHLILFIGIVIQLISLKIPFVQSLLEITVSVFVLYLLIMVGTPLIGRWFLLHRMENKLSLRNRKFYAIYIYFSFIIGKNSLTK